MLSQCVVCKKLEGTWFAQPPVSTLPEFRVRPSPPFSKVGVEFAGPLYVKTRGKQVRKLCIALFSCCVTRALYLDVVEDLSAKTFLHCLRKLGTPTLIVSDNAKTFKRTEKELQTNALPSHRDNSGLSGVSTWRGPLGGVDFLNGWER